MVLNTGPLDWESSDLTTRPLEKVLGVFVKMLKRLQNKTLYLMPPSRHDHFHPILILPVKTIKLRQQHAITIVHWL